MKFGPDEGNSGAIVRWGKHLDNGVWIAWKHWKSQRLLKRFRFMRGYIAISLLTVMWGNEGEQ
jgi:hypothetical protein